MSVWSSCSGYMVIQKDSGFSLRKYVKGLYDECTINSYEQRTTDHGIYITFSMTFSLSGLAAAKMIQEMVDYIRGLNKNNWIDIEANIRFL